MDHIQELREKRKKLSEDAHVVLKTARDEKRELTEEERTKVDAMFTDVDVLKRDIERYEKAEEEERALAALPPRSTDPPKSEPEKLDLRAMINNPEMSTVGHEIPLFAKPEERASTVSDLAGAIDVSVAAAFEEALLWYGPMWQVAEVMRTSTGNSLQLPTINDTGNAGTILAEAGTITTADPTFSSVVLGAYKTESKLVLISNETLQDTTIPLEPIIGRILGERIARGTNTMFTTKTDGPTGLATTQCGATVGKTATATNAFTLPEVIDLVHSIDPAYRPMSSFQMHDNVVAAARKLVDSNDRPLWEPSVQAGQPDMLYGYPVRINNAMATTLATGNKIMLFGAMNKYKIRVAGGLRIIAARELYAANDQTGFFGFLRVDGNLLDAGTDPVKWLALA